MQRLGDVALACVGTDHQAADSTAVSKLRAVGPLFYPRWSDVIPPTAPVVPGDEDRNVRPQSGRADRRHLAHSPLAAFADAAGTRRPLRRGVRRLFAHHIVCVEPRDRGPLLGGGVATELLPDALR